MLSKGRPFSFKYGVSTEHQSLRSFNGSRINTPSSGGFVLPMVIAGGLILMIGAIILSMRSFSGLRGAIRQGQRTQTEEIAETGANMIIQELNQNYPYLLVVNCEVTNNSASEQMEPPECEEGWESYELDGTNPIGKCDQRQDLPSDINVFRQLFYQPEGKGYYRLRSYEFLGDRIQGGTAIIQVQGQLINGPNDDQKITSSAVLQREITIVPKCCDLALFETCNSSQGWNYGLATETIALQTGDIIDEDPNVSISGANVHCSSCNEPPTDKCIGWSDAGQMIPLSKREACRNGVDITEDMVGVIDGERTSGSIDIPEAPTWNTERWGDPEPFTIGYDPFRPDRGYYAPKITHANQEGPHPNIDGCYTEITNGKKTTHCRIKTITASAQSKLDIDPGDGDIRFYVEGSTINLSGDHFIIPDDAKFGQFAIFGGASTWESAHEKFKSWGKGDKSLNFSGSGEINAFLHMPYFNINFSGGECWRPLIVRGAAITNGWNSTGDCAQIQVPTNASTTICDIYSVCSTTSSKTNNDMEFAAIGTKRWDYVQSQP